MKKVVKAKPVTPQKTDGESIMESLYALCYYYPRYSLEEAANLPYHQVLGLLDTAHKENAKEYLTLTSIAAAPHTKKGSGVKKLQSDFKRQING